MIDRLKIRFPLVEDASGIEAEWMWAKPLSGPVLELDNSPFHVFGISHKDTFRVHLIDGALEFDRIEQKGGHRTIRVRFPRDGAHADFERIWAPLAALGCTFEGSQLERPLYSIDVPPGVNLEEAIAYLADLERREVLEYEKADCF